MCSIETNFSINPTENAKATIMNQKQNTNTLSDSDTFRHRHRRIWPEDDRNFGRNKRPKLKSPDAKTNLMSTAHEIKRTISSHYQVNSNSVMSRKSVQLVILTIGLMVSLMITTVSAFNVDVNSKIVHTAPRSTCDDECMFGFSVAQHREKGQSW